MNTLRAILEWVRARPVLVILIALLIFLLAVFVVVGVSDPAWIYRFFGMEKGTEKFRILEFVGVGMGGVLLAIGATIAHSRAKAMEKTANAQAKAAEAQAQAAAQQAAANRGAEDGRRQERLKNAIEHLGHESDSVRMGGAYELFHLARDTEDLRQTVMDILCAHIRRTTGKDEYREKHKSEPSTEIQSLLTLLFVQEHEVFRGNRIDLQGSWLNGASLKFARLQGANLSEGQLQRAGLIGAHLQGATLIGMHLQGADLSGAQLQRADLIGAQLQGANLFIAQLHGADLDGAHLQGASLFGTQLQGVICSVGGWLRFEEHIRAGIGRESNLSTVTFTGGLSREDVDSLISYLPSYAVDEFRRKLEPHISKPASYKLPEDSGAIVGAYTKEEAEQWIAEYEEAMRGVPKAGA